MPLRSTSTVVHVEDLHLEAYVGLHAPEREQLQTVAVDVSCTLEEPRVMDDDLAQSVDYIPIVEKVKALALTRKRRLIETFAEEIAEACFENARVKSVVVSVRKPYKLPGTRSVGITRTFEKGS